MAVSYYKTYTDAANAAQQQQRLAEMLQQQAQEPMPQYAYQGIQAMPSYAAGLAKILNAYGARKASEQAAEASRQAGERVEQAGTGIAGRLLGGFTPDASLVKKTDMGYEATPQQVPEQTSLEEVTRTSQYKQSPQDALRMAMTPAGGAAMRGNPLLAQMLAKTVQTPDQTKIFGDIDPSKYKPESLKQFAATAAAGKPDYSLLVPIEKPTKAPTTAGGMMWDESSQSWKAIPGYAAQQKEIAAARSDARGSGISDDAVDALAQRYIAGDKTALVGMGRSTAAMSKIQNRVAQMLKEQGATPQEITNNMRRLDQTNQTEKAYTTGKPALALRSLNAFSQHADALEQMADALDRSDYPALNQLQIAWQQQTGQAAPNNLQLVGQLVADELQKAALGAPGGQAEREELVKRLTGAKSGKVIKEAIAQARGLVGGQLAALKQGYVAGNGTGDFEERFLTPEAKKSLTHPTTDGGELPPQARAALKEGQTTTFANGQSWTLQNGQAKRVK